MKFECAGKLILLGEYSVITGGPALVAAIPPFFSVTVSVLVVVFSGVVVVGRGWHGRSLCRARHQIAASGRAENAARAFHLEP